MSGRPYREALIDTGAISRNVARLREQIRTRELLAVVKANAYGHGAVPVARAALAGGADWLGTADLREAVALREAGIDAPVLCWLHDPDETFDAALEHGIGVGISSHEQLLAVAATAERRRGTASVQLKLETGLSRNGIPESAWGDLFVAAGELERRGVLSVDGLFSHLSNTSREDDLVALDRFEHGVAVARAAGLSTPRLHLAATAAALSLPETRLTMARVGIGIYGIDPLAGVSSSELGLTPAMTLRARVSGVRRVPAGAGVSYDYTYRTPRETTLALIPLGYAEGIPRSASGVAQVSIGGARYTIAGRVAMDQFVVDVGDAPVAVGDEVVLWGDPSARGAGDPVPSVDDWARWCGTINYEMVTRVGPRVVRSLAGETPSGETP